MIGVLGTNKISYQFEKPKYKVSIITGDSGSGKTTLYDMVRAYNNNPQIIQLKWDGNCDLDLIYCSKNDMPYHLTDIKNSVIVADENCALLTKVSYKELAKFVKDSPNYFFFITRQFKKLIGISISLQSLFYIKLIGKRKNAILPYFPNEIYKSYDKVYVDTILCEDSKSSYLFFRDYFGFLENKNLFTASGKDSVVLQLENLVAMGKDNILVVIDSCAFGLNIFDLKKTCSLYPVKNIYVLDWKSYEYYLLESKNIERFQDSSEPVFMEEVYYESELKKHLLQYTKSGIEGKLPICLDLFHRCVKSDCNYFDFCTAKIDDSLKYDKKAIYIHNPMERFQFRPNYPQTGISEMSLF